MDRIHRIFVIGLYYTDRDAMKQVEKHFSTFILPISCSIYDVKVTFKYDNFCIISGTIAADVENETELEYLLRENINYYALDDFVDSILYIRVLGDARILKYYIEDNGKQVNEGKDIYTSKPKKKPKKGTKGWFVNPNAGNVEASVAFFNRAMGGNQSNTQSGGEQGAGDAGVSAGGGLGEEYKPNETYCIWVKSLDDGYSIFYISHSKEQLLDNRNLLKEFAMAEFGKASIPFVRRYRDIFTDYFDIKKDKLYDSYKKLGVERYDSFGDTYSPIVILDNSDKDKYSINSDLAIMTTVSGKIKKDNLNPVTIVKKYTI